MSREELPKLLRDRLAAELPGEEVRLAAGSDLGRDGCFGEEWLVLAGTRLLVCAGEAEGHRVLFNEPLERIKRVKLVNLTGKAALEAEINGAGRHLIGYSNARSREFGHACDDLNQIIAGEAEAPPEGG